MQPGTLVMRTEDLRPDENWLLDMHQVAGHAWRRGCDVVYRSEFALDITYPDRQIDGTRKTVVVTVSDSGLWSLTDVLAACREATGYPHYVIDPTKIRLRNPNGIDELRIARIMAADGIRPYRMLARRRRGDWTMCMARVMEIRDGVVSRASHHIYDFRRCVRALNDMGLLMTRFGRNGGLCTASHCWLPPAYLPTAAPAIEIVDECALREIAL